MDSLNTVVELKKSGRFLEALEALDGIRSVNLTAANILRLELLERLGHHDECQSLTEQTLKSKHLTTSQRATCEYVIGRILLERSNRLAAITRLQRAASLARHGGDLELLCEVQMRLLVLVSDHSGPDAAVPILAELRRNTVTLGDTQTTAGLHAFVAEMEASRGLLHSAQRHLRITSGFLGELENPWLSAFSENILLAASLLMSDLQRGQTHATRAMQFADESGAASTRRVLSTNCATLYYLMGDFDRAFDSIHRALSFLPSSGERRNGGLDTLARIRLTQGRLTECAEILDSIEHSIKTDADRSLNAHRYALLTRTQLLARQGSLGDALAKVETLLEVASRVGDRLLSSTARLTKAELLQMAGRTGDAMAVLEFFADQLHNQSPELYAQYERTVACALLRQREPDAASAHYRRAHRICDGIRSVPARMELNRRWEQEVANAGPATERPTSADRRAAEAVGKRDALHSLAALVGHTGRGEFVAREIAELLVASESVQSAAVVIGAAGNQTVLYRIGEARGDGAQTGQRSLTVPSNNGESIEIIVVPRTSVDAAATLNAVTCLLSTLHELDRARTEREERATIWPVEESPVGGDHSVLSGQMRDLMMLAERVARTTVNVLITGDSGTGKEIVARAIHNYSPRARKPFVPFNCAAVPRDLVESQLFGHRRGAFTGAERDYSGLIRAADGGTLFLDEIGELGLDLQPKLLRFLESGEISPLGEPAPLTVDVRIVAATNTNLEEAVREGKFREDLFYRLNVVRLSLKPLRERRDEIPGLVNHFVARAAQEFGKGRLEIAEETMERLLLYRWPGNVRQLQNELRRMVALAEPNATLEPAAISEDILRAMPIFRSDPVSGKEIAVRLNDKLLPTLSRIECEMIKTALRDNHGKVDAVARALGISRKGLYLKRQRLGL